MKVYVLNVQQGISGENFLLGIFSTIESAANSKEANEFLSIYDGRWVGNEEFNKDRDIRSSFAYGHHRERLIIVPKILQN